MTAMSSGICTPRWCSTDIAPDRQQIGAAEHCVRPVGQRQQPGHRDTPGRVRSDGWLAATACVREFGQPPAPPCSPSSAVTRCRPGSRRHPDPAAIRRQPRPIRCSVAARAATTVLHPGVGHTRRVGALAEDHHRHRAAAAFTSAEVRFNGEMITPSSACGPSPPTARRSRSPSVWSMSRCTHDPRPPGDHGGRLGEVGRGRPRQRQADDADLAGAEVRADRFGR